MSAIAEPITIDQFLMFQPPVRFRDELIAGEIVLSPDPKANHQEIAFRFLQILNRLLSVEKSQFVVRERTNIELPGLHSMPSPDLFVIDIGTWKEAVHSSGYPKGAPPLVIEIVSPSNRRKRVLQKAELYLEAGSVEVWVVLPKTNTVEIHRKDRPVVEESRGLRLPQPLPDWSGEVNLRSVFDLEQ